MNTTIQVKQDTVERLKYFKEFSKESYDELINKLIDSVEEEQLTDEALEDIQQSLRDVRAGKGESLEAVAKEFGVDL